MKKSCLPLHKLDHLQSPNAKRIARSVSPRSFPRRKLPTPLHDQLRLKKISKSLLPPKVEVGRTRLGICSRGVAGGARGSSARAKHAQITRRTFRRVRIHVHPSRALSRPPKASVPPRHRVRFPTVRPGFPNRISTRRARLARRTFSLARVFKRGEQLPFALFTRAFARSRPRARVRRWILPLGAPDWRGG